MELQALIDGLKAHKSGAASYESVDEAIRVFEAMCAPCHLRYDAQHHAETRRMKNGTD